jgi:peroxiredoxin
MSLKRRFQWNTAVLALAVIGFGCSTNLPTPEPTQDGNVDRPAPARMMMDGPVVEKEFDHLPAFVFRDLSGKEVSSERFRGKVLLVDVWATWCQPCKQEMPWFQELYEEYGQQGLDVVGISIDVTAQAAARFAEQYGIRYTLLHHPAVMQEWGLLGLPTTFIVDREGGIRTKVIGFEYKEAFEEAVKQLL